MTPPSIRNYLSGVKFLHVSLGYPFPDLSTHEIQVTLRGIDRLAQHCPLRAPPTLSMSPFLAICVCLFSFSHGFLIWFQTLGVQLMIINAFVGGTSNLLIMGCVLVLDSPRLINLGTVS